jgi:hypothetical protein
MIRALLNLTDLDNGEARPRTDCFGISLRDLAELRHRLARERLNLQPDLEFPLLGPEIAHRSARVTIDHARKLERRRKAESHFVRKKAPAHVKRRPALSKI